MTDPDADPDVALARDLAERVIARLGPGAPSLRIREVERTGPDLVYVELSARVPGASRMGAYLTTSAPHADAVTATTSQWQEHVLELTYGEPLPPCPGHHHPLDPKVLDGVACWVCPKDPAHHAEPIMAADDTGAAPSVPAP